MGLKPLFLSHVPEAMEMAMTQSVGGNVSPVFTGLWITLHNSL